LFNDAVSKPVYIASNNRTIFSLLSFYLKKLEEAYEITLLFVCRISPLVARQRLGKHVPAATNTHATIEEFLDAVIVVCVVSDTSYIMKGN
jgi:hypothetical protein